MNLDHELDNSDLYSDTTSQYSAGMSSVIERQKGGRPANPMSIQTKASSTRTKSSKNRRKAERKKFSTREGGIHEDIGLITSLHQLITEVYHQIVPEASGLTRALVRIHGQFDNAKQLQSETASLVDVIADKESFIWGQSAETLRTVPMDTMVRIPDTYAFAEPTFTEVLPLVQYDLF